jgi:ribosomal protein S1
MKKTPCGLADLARAFQTLHPSLSECVAIAHLLGLKGIILESEAAEQRAHIPADRFSVPPLTLADEDEVSAEGSRRHTRPLRWEHERRVEPPDLDAITRPVILTVVKPPPTGEMPSYVAEAEELNFHRGTHRNLPPPQPLVPHNQLRSLISDLITTPIPASLDLERIVIALARGRVPRQLPRIRRRGFARRIHVIWDTADPMWLFRRDATAVLDRLDALAGNAVQSESISHGPPMMERLAGAARGDTLVILSALGIGGGSRLDARLQERWNEFGAFQRRLGLRAAALMPFHPKRWPSRLKRNFRIVHWHRPGIVASGAKQSDLHYLARILSLAAVVDPALLRYIRTKILPASDGGVEADFVSSPWVASFNPRVVLLNPRWTVVLRAELADDPLVMEAARHLLTAQRPKEDSWGRVVCEEVLIYLSLQKDAHSQEDLRRALARVIRSLLGRMRDGASARWALYLLQDFPEMVQQTEAAQLLKAVASIILNTSSADVAAIVARQNANWIFNESTRVGVRWTGECIIVCEPPEITDQILEVPATRPRVVIVSTPDEVRTKVLRISRWKFGWTRATTLPRVLKTTAGAVYRVDAYDDTEIWDRLQQACDANQTVVGELSAGVTGDFYRVNIGVPALLNKKELITKSFKAFHEMLATPQEFKILSMDREGRSVVVALKESPSNEVWASLRNKFKEGATIMGTVKQVVTDFCLVDIGVTAFAPLTELEAGEARQPDKLLGQTLGFCIVEISSLKKAKVLLSRKLNEQARFREIETFYKAKKIIAGTVLEKTAVGFNVDVGISAFLPNEEVNFDAPLIGKRMNFAVKALQLPGRLVTLSLKLAQKWQETQRFVEELQPGTICRGVVTSITQFGAFIDLGKLVALIHITDMSWEKLAHPSELVEIGQELTTVVIEVDKERRRVLLGLKQLTSNPWSEVKTKYPLGSRVKGRVINVVPYGAFIELEAGIAGLIHVSELSWDTPAPDPRNILKEGEEIEAVVLNVEHEKRRISLSIRQLIENPSP